jgi:hypothetical protein
MTNVRIRPNLTCDGKCIRSGCLNNAIVTLIVIENGEKCFLKINLKINFYERLTILSFLSINSSKTIYTIFTTAGKRNSYEKYIH